MSSTGVREHDRPEYVGRTAAAAGREGVRGRGEGVDVRMLFLERVSTLSGPGRDLKPRRRCPLGGGSYRNYSDTITALSRVTITYTYYIALPVPEFVSSVALVSWGGGV